MPLPSWPHCNDYLTVWRRMPTCHVALSGAAEDGGQQHDRAPAAAPPQEDKNSSKNENEQNATEALCAGARAPKPQQAAATATGKFMDGDKRAQQARESGERARKGASEGEKFDTEVVARAEEEKEGQCGDASEGKEEHVVEEGGSEEEEAEGGDVMEFQCGARNFSLGAEGWALPVFRHLL